MKRVECVVRVPPDVTGRTYFEGETYNLSPEEYDKLKAAGHFGAKYGAQVVEPHFVELPEEPKPAARAANAGEGGKTESDLEALTKAQLADLAGPLGIRVDATMKKADLIEAIQKARAAQAGT